MSIIINNQQSHLTLPMEDIHSSPPVGAVSLYIKTDGSLYKKDSTGVESAIGGGSVAEPDGQLLYGTGVGVSSSGALTYDETGGGFMVDSTQLGRGFPSHIELYAAPTTGTTWQYRGGQIVMSAGNAIAGGAYGGAVDISAGDAQTGTTGGMGGELNFTSGSGQYGGNVYIQGGTGSGNGNGGGIDISSGSGGGESGGGYVTIAAGGGNYSGDVVIKCNDVVTAWGNRGGHVDIMGGGSTGTDAGVGGRVAVVGGSGKGQPYGAFYVYGGNVTLGVGAVSTSACTLSQVKESIQAPMGVSTTTAGLLDVSGIPCTRQLTLGGTSSFTPTMILSLPVQIPTTSVWLFKAAVVVSYLQYGSDSAAYEVTGALVRNGDTVTIHNPVTTVIYESAGATGWDVAAQANVADLTLQFVCSLGGVGYRAVAITVTITQAGVPT